MRTLLSDGRGQPKRRAWGLAAGLMVVLTAGCRTQAPELEAEVHVVEPAPAPARVVGEDVNDVSQANAAVLRELAGTWRVQSASGSDQAGHVFQPRIGAQVEFRDDTLSLPGRAPDEDLELRKTIRVIRAQGTLTIDLDHRGDFSRASTPGEDAAARHSPNSKGWSRHAIVQVEGDTMTLALGFPQKSAPKDFEPDGGTVEIVVLTRVL